MKTVLITGATDGIGLKTAEVMATQNCKLILHGRNIQLLTQIKQDLMETHQPVEVEIFEADFADLGTVEKMVVEMEMRGVCPDILINNAATFEPSHVLLNGDIEKTFQVNFLAPYYLTRQLIPRMFNCTSPRIVNVSSMAQIGTVDFNNLMGDKYFDGYEAYALSKLANVLFTYKLHRLYSNQGLTTICLHPGVVSTKLLHSGWGLGGVPVSKGAEKLCFASFSDDIHLAGKYLVNNRPVKSAAISYDKKIQDRMWQIGAQYTGLLNA